MIDSFVTQCPQCSTSFRISRSQLSAARGAVRCGACLHVFNAAQQLLVDQNRAHKPAPLQAPASTGPAPVSHAAVPALAEPGQPARSSQPAAPGNPPPAGKPDIDTLWIHDDLDLDSLDLELAKLEAQEKSARNRQADPAPAPVIDTGITHSSAAAAEPHADDDPGQPEQPPPAPTPISSASRDAARPRPNGSDGSLQTLSDDPLRLDWQAPKKRWGRPIAWLLLNLLALVALAGQYINQNFDALARQDSWRPWFEQLCPELGCQLPPRVDVEQIKSTNLVVRSHPDYLDALLVDAILYNRATFAQPFPLLELRFADLSGQAVASSRFRPGEYLSGELAGQTSMPPQTPIHIALEIRDPGPEAVNYSLHFHSPE